MKTYNNKVTQATLVLGSALVLGATSLLAQNASSGALSAPAPGLRSGFYLGADAGVNLLQISGTESSVTADSGLRLDLTTGYAFKLTDHVTLAPELEVGYIENTFKSADSSHTRELDQVPVLGNVLLNWELTPNWTLYGGGGAGVDSYSVSSSDTVFAWQGEAGIRYAFGSSEIGVGYKYLGFETSDHVNIDNHSILASFTYHF